MYHSSWQKPLINSDDHGMAALGRIGVASAVVFNSASTTATSGITIYIHSMYFEISSEEKKFPNFCINIWIAQSCKLWLFYS